MGADPQAFDARELRQIAERAMSLARQHDDPSLRIALSLLAESAMNLASKLPQSDTTSER